MEARIFSCAACGSDVLLEDDAQSVCCPGCATWYHAYRCEHCGRAFLAVGKGRQICPHCFAAFAFEARLAHGRDVADPLSESINGVQVLRQRAQRPTPAPGTVVIPEQSLLNLGTTLAWILSILAAIVFVLGTWVMVEDARIVAHAHGHTLVTIAAVELPTVTLTMILVALAFLVENVAEVRRVLERMDQRGLGISLRWPRRRRRRR